MPTRATDGDLVQLFIGQRPRLRRIAHGVVRCPEVAEEIVQDAYIRVIELTDGQAVVKPTSYCGQIVRNLALDYCRRRSLEAVHRNFDIDADTVHRPCPSSPDKSMCCQQVIQAVEAALTGLRAKARKAYEMHLVQGLTQREIAQKLNCSLGSVNTLVNEAVEAVATCRHMLEDD